VRSAFEKDRGLHNLMSSLLTGSQVDENKRIKIIVYDDGRGKQSRKGHLELELKRLEEEKLFDWITKVQVRNQLYFLNFNSSLEFWSQLYPWIPERLEQGSQISIYRAAKSSERENIPK
jgi:hypothetical protein